MRRLFPLLAALSLLLSPVFAQEAEQCHRPPPEGLAKYKDNYVPQEFDWESFRWEIADVAVLAFMLALASLLSVRHQPKCRFTALTVVGLLYFGLFRGGCICPVGATTNFCIGLAAPELIGKTVAILFLMPLATAFFFGRVFCTSACPLGAIQHIFSRTNGYQVPKKIERVLTLLPFLVLASTVWGALRGGFFLACRLDPYKPAFFTGHAWIDHLSRKLHGLPVEAHPLLIGDWIMWTTFAVVLVLGIFVPRPFCRYACPYGVLLGFFAKVGLRKRTIDAESCFSCIMCTKTCPVQAISSDHLKRVVKVNHFKCIQCGRCDGTCSTGSFQSPSPFPDAAHFPNIGKN